MAHNRDPQPAWPSAAAYYVRKPDAVLRVVCKGFGCGHVGIIPLARLKVPLGLPMNRIGWRCSKCGGCMVMWGWEHQPLK